MRTILVVDDEEPIRLPIQELLESRGHRVLAAANGKEALDLLSGPELPCVIVLDLMMPVMSGPQFLAARRANSRIDRIPVIILSAWLNDSTMRLAEAECIETLRKPFDEQRLLQLVEAHCNMA